MAEDWKAHIPVETLEELESRCELLTVVAAPGGRASLLFARGGEDTVGKRDIKDPQSPEEWQRAAEDVLGLLDLIVKANEKVKSDDFTVRPDDV